MVARGARSIIARTRRAAQGWLRSRLAPSGPSAPFSTPSALTLDRGLVSAQIRDRRCPASSPPGSSSSRSVLSATELLTATERRPSAAALGASGILVATPRAGRISVFFLARARTISRIRASGTSSRVRRAPAWELRPRAGCNGLPSYPFLRPDSSGTSRALVLGVLPGLLGADRWCCGAAPDLARRWRRAHLAAGGVLLGLVVRVVIHEAMRRLQRFSPRRSEPVRFRATRSFANIPGTSSSYSARPHRRSSFRPFGPTGMPLGAPARPSRPGLRARARRSRRCRRRRMLVVRTLRNPSAGGPDWSRTVRATRRPV